MRTVRVVNRRRRVDLAPRVRVADTRWTRLRGLLGRPRLRTGEGLLLTPSRGVHTWWMRYPIDVVFLGSEGQVVAVYPELDAWDRTRMHLDAERVLELPGGTIEATNTHLGDQLDIVPCDQAGNSETASLRRRDLA